MFSVAVSAFRYLKAAVRSVACFEANKTAISPLEYFLAIFR